MRSSLSNSVVICTMYSESLGQNKWMPIKRDCKVVAYRGRRQQTWHDGCIFCAGAEHGALLLGDFLEQDDGREMINLDLWQCGHMVFISAIPSWCCSKNETYLDHQFLLLAVYHKYRGCQYATRWRYQNLQGWAYINCNSSEDSFILDIMKEIMIVLEL